MKRVSLKIRMIYLLVAGGAMLNSGCGKKETAHSAPPPADSAAVALVSPAPTRQNVQPIAMPAAAADSTATLDALTQALRKYAIEHRGMPKSFADVVAAGYVKNLPTPPPGKKFEVEPKSGRVILVKQ